MSLKQSISATLFGVNVGFISFTHGGYVMFVSSADHDIDRCMLYWRSSDGVASPLWLFCSAISILA